MHTKLSVFILVGLALPIGALPATAQEGAAHGITGIDHSVSAPRVADLHPAFILSARRLEAVIRKGQALAKAGKTEQDIRRLTAQLPRGIKGERGRSHESLVTCPALEWLDVLLAAFNAANAYEPVALPEEMRRGDFFLRTLDFTVNLTSTPQMRSGLFTRYRESDAGDVTVRKFVLSDDQGNIILPSGTATTEGVTSGNITFSGTSAIVRSTANQQTITTFNTTTTDSDGNSSQNTTTATANTSTQVVDYQPWTEQHPYYSATYQVRFPLFDSQGNPVITTRVRKLTLHIVTATGERIAEYKLSSGR